MFGSLKKSLFTLSPQEASFERRNFDCVESMARASLEEILRVFISGYNLTLEIPNYELLAQRLDLTFDSHHVGFAYEGAGMCCALLDLLATREVVLFNGRGGEYAGRHAGDGALPGLPRRGLLQQIHEPHSRTRPRASPPHRRAGTTG